MSLNVPHFKNISCSAVQRAVPCSLMQYHAALCSLVQGSAVQYSVMKWRAVHCIDIYEMYILGQLALLASSLGGYYRGDEEEARCFFFCMKGKFLKLPPADIVKENPAQSQSVHRPHVHPICDPCEVY